MKFRKKALASLAVAAVALATYTTSVLAESGSDTTDQVVLGRTITKDPEAAALVPAKFKGTLRFATSAPYPPFEFMDERNELTGIDIDISRVIAAKLGVKITFDNLGFDGLIPSVQAGKYNVIASSLGDTPEREKILNFVDFTTLGNVVLVRAQDQSINSHIDLCGKTLTRQSGDVFGDFIEHKLQPKCDAAGKSKIKVKTLPDSNAALLAVKSGSADAQITGLTSAVSVMNSKENSGQFRIIKPANSPRGWKLSNGGFGILKSETELTKAVEAATKAAKADGILQAIADHYGHPAIIIDDVVVNVPVPANGGGEVE